MTSAGVSSLFDTLDSLKISGIASRLGESPEAISHGLESSTAALIGGMANKASDSSWMNQVFKFISQAPSTVNLSELASSATGSSRGSPATSSLLDSGRSFLSLIFGQNQSSVFDLVGRSTGLRSSVITSLMGMAAPLLMTTLGRVVREGHMSSSSLQDLLMHEGKGVAGLLPSGFSDMLKGTPVRPTPIESARPIALGTVAEPATSWRWLIPAALLLVPLLYWGWTRYRPIPEAGRTTFGTPAPIAPEVRTLGTFGIRTLPGNVSLNIPQNGVESQLLGFIQDPSRGVDRNLWFNYDRLLFDTNSATLRPESGEQLRNIASILKAYPNVNITIGGYTDSIGDGNRNLRLSQARADGVMAELVRLGVSPNRMQAKGYRELHPVGNNSTPEGRAMNRRIAMNVTQK